MNKNNIKNHEGDKNWSWRDNKFRMVLDYFKITYESGIDILFNNLAAVCKTPKQLRKKYENNADLRIVIDRLYEHLHNFNVKENF